MLSLFAVIWISLLALLDMTTEEHTAYVALLFSGWGALAIAGLILQ